MGRGAYAPGRQQRVGAPKGGKVIFLQQQLYDNSMTSVEVGMAWNDKSCA